MFFRYAALIGLVFLGCGSAPARADETGKQAISPCGLRLRYADKRPYESPKSDPFYAAAYEYEPRRLFQTHWGRLVIRTETGLYVKSTKGTAGIGALEFTLPTHERVVEAWIDAERSPDGSMVPCLPSSVFVVDGFDGVEMTKQQKRFEAVSRSVISTDTQFDLGFGLKVRYPGPRPSGLPLTTPACDLPDHPATAPEPVLHLNRAGPEAASLVVDIGVDGRAIDADIKKSAGSRSLDETMLHAAHDLTYQPALWHCMPVPARILLPVVFERRP